MAVVVRNESANPWVFDKSRGSRQIASGEIQVISDEEWESVITAKRGSGNLNPIWPNYTDSGNANHQRFDYYTPFADTEVHYIGTAIQGSLDTDPTWTIKRFGHTNIAGSTYVTDIQVMTNVAWTDRDSLAWT